MEPPVPLCSIHGSPPNNSQEPRPVFIHRYRRPNDYVVISATTAENRAEAEIHAEESSKDRQRGLMARGFRNYEDT